MDIHDSHKLPSQGTRRMLLEISSGRLISLSGPHRAGEKAILQGMLSRGLLNSDGTLTRAGTDILSRLGHRFAMSGQIDIPISYEQLSHAESVAIESTLPSHRESKRPDRMAKQQVSSTVPELNSLTDPQQAGLCSILSGQRPASQRVLYELLSLGIVIEEKQTLLIAPGIKKQVDVWLSSSRWPPAR